MTAATELRVRSKIAPDVLEGLKGKVLGDRDYDVLLAGPTNLYGPAGQLIAKYLPGALDEGNLLADTYGTLHALKPSASHNRGLASGLRRIEPVPGARSSTSQPVASAIIGSFDPAGPKRYCRLTAFSGREVDKFTGLFPLFEAIGDRFATLVPDRYEAQMAFIKQTHPDWVIGRTPFTTITVNNSYPTGVHTDRGDLEEGFSNLAVLRRGSYSGGIFVFAEYRVGVDMQHGDLLLMDAHEWHGNTSMHCNVCGDRMGPGGRSDHDERCHTERISVVAYYRTRMAECGSAEEEGIKARELMDTRAEVDRMAEESLG